MDETPVPEVVDRPDRHRLIVDIEGHQAELTYRVRDGWLQLLHTGVPDALGGRGVGGRLVRAAVDKAVREGLGIAPWCPFAKNWLTQHPEVAGLAPVDWEARPPSGR